jgi:hypothetical protein
MASFGVDDVRIWEDVSEPVSQNWNPLVERGVTGVKRSAGLIDEEFLPALRGRKAIEVFREMSTNDSIVGALLFAIDKLIREVEWHVEAPDNTPEGTECADFLESCMDDMEHSWDDFVSEVMTMLVFGWSWHEIVYKKRIGPWEKDGRKKSNYDDGMIGWRKMPIRSQETMLRWLFDKNGDVEGLVQLAPPFYQVTTIPMSKSLLFRTAPSKGNPEGRSLLRTAYRSWYFKKRLEEFEGIGVERDLAGMPVARVPADYLNAPTGSQKAKVVDGFRKMVRGVRRDENEGLVLPVMYDPDTKQPLFDFELMSSSGARQFDTNAIIQRYEQRILMSCLADFILVGHEQSGSYSMHTDKTGIFRASLNSITKNIADTLNRKAIPKLFELNGWKVRELPKIVASEIDPPDLTQLGQLISSTAGAGMQWFPDPELEKFIRDIARLPEMPDEVLEIKRQQAMQEQAMSLADSQMQMLGLQQKAELTSQGYSPEQAQMIGETPTPEMAGYQTDQMMQQQQADLEMQSQYAMKDDPAAAAQHSRDNEAFARDQKGKDADLKRQQQQLALQDQYKNKDLGREKEKAKLNERGHKTKVQLEGMKGKVGVQNEKGKLSLEAQRAKIADQADKSKFDRQMAMLKEKGKQTRTAASKKPLPGKTVAAAKKTAAKKTPPKKKGR